MPTTCLARALAAAFLAALAVPGAAHGAALAPLKQCYVSVTEKVEGKTEITREMMDLTATGFTPSSLVDVSVNSRLRRTVQADANGNLPVQSLESPYVASGQRGFSVTAMEKGNPANSATANSNASALSLGIMPKVARPSTRVRFRGRGFTRPLPVYAHYLLRGRARKTVMLKRTTAGPCGTFTVRKRQIPIRRVRTGKWLVQVDQQKAYSPTPDSVYVRFNIDVTRVFRLLPR